ncbi:hypothetical protein LL033_11930 [Clostridium estertheticum]|uniref:hypothetical protein n=1 Tax=Clostridium estertheticum TaxID=238834 RepID=UPI001C0C62B3|nr:hypothetical protein [Clostridium estertheticum]MBU3215860.1 hypothetical protein [Clostridium estertheticum]WAG57816.1 hypothetical protein LL033_11930 [Clostridium estertheticum]
MKIYINEDTEEILNALVDRNIVFNERGMEVKKQFYYDYRIRMIFCSEYIEVEYNEEYLRFSLNRSDEEILDKLNNVFNDGIDVHKQFSQSRLCECAHGLNDGEIMINLKVN